MAEEKQPNFLKRVAKLQAELKAPKSQYNKFGNYNYRNIEDILEAVKPLNQKYDLTLVMTDAIEVIDGRFYVMASARLHDNHTPEHIEVTGYARETENRKGMDPSQVTGSASSYARKYALGGLYLVDDNKGADGQDNRQQGQPQQPKQPNLFDHIKEVQGRINNLAQAKNTTSENITSWIAQHVGSQEINEGNISQWVGYLKQLEAKANG